MFDSYDSKPVTINAERWDGTPGGATPIIDYILTAGGTARYRSFTQGSSNAIAIDTLEGTMEAAPGDWIICGTEGEFYPCKPSVFDRKYQPSQPAIPSAPLPESDEPASPEITTYRSRVIRSTACPYCLAAAGDPCVRMAGGMGIEAEELIPIGYVHDSRSLAYSKIEAL